MWYEIMFCFPKGYTVMSGCFMEKYWILSSVLRFIKSTKMGGYHSTYHKHVLQHNKRMQMFGVTYKQMSY